MQLGAVPKAGDVSICIRCGTANVFTDSLGNIRRATAEELKQFQQNIFILGIQRLIRAEHN
jgi:hypothetical protein